MGLHIAKDTTLSDSIKTNYHRIVEFSFNALTGRTIVVVQSYITEQDEEAGKAPYSQSAHELKTVNPMAVIEAAHAGIPVLGVIQNMLETAIVNEVEEFAGATIG